MSPAEINGKVAGPKAIDLGHYDPTGEYNTDEYEPQGLFFDAESAAKFRKVEPRTHRFVIPEAAFKGHCVLVGQSGSGKTQTMLRLVDQVVSEWHWQVIIVDAKADANLESELQKIAAKANVKYGAFPTRPYDLWHGASSDIATRLLDLVEIGTDQAALAHQLLAKAVEGGVAKGESWNSFIHNLTNLALNAESDAVKKKLIGQLKGLFEGSLAELLVEKKTAGGKPVLPINVASVDICYIGIDALALPFAASQLASCLLHEVADFIVKRRTGESPKVLLLFDEFSAVPVSLATDLVERIRSFGVQVVLGVQSFAGLGFDGNRLLEASNWVFLHRSAHPEPFLNVIGTSKRKERTGPLIDGLELRRLEDGRMYVALNGRVAKVAVAQWGA
jgi:hypothetical protein